MKVLFFRSEPVNISGLPSIEIINVPIFTPFCVDYSIELDNFESVAFTSKNAIRCCKDINRIKSMKVFSIGPATASELQKHGIESIIPDKFDSENLGKTIINYGVKSLVSFRSKKANDTLRNILSDKIKYEEIYNYDIILNEEMLKKAKEFLDCNVDVVVLTSSEIARVTSPYLKKCYKIISIGPVTSSTLKKNRPDLEIIDSKKYDLEGIIEILVGLDSD
ncbi:uroporphyrinogen III synthase [Candidatus Acidianus copahuensis]|uniref:Uroporphyrinogen III synthase n=1 Tax=Candidatus Acidianus copahuensis TaxID=1160895 RepID=A0A031LM28_9CREN|nr:uroporphyrinogen-III synthase [Candidatus Acidianus copahuensis]EZQ03802.1 uroporphyrinogen III synthase [Candidatus Acidianus copahuensis]